jgi:hypothetical protein
MSPLHRCGECHVTSEWRFEKWKAAQAVCVGWLQWGRVFLLGQEFQWGC